MVKPLALTTTTKQEGLEQYCASTAMASKERFSTYAGAANAIELYPSF